MKDNSKKLERYEVTLNFNDQKDLKEIFLDYLLNFAS